MTSDFGHITIHEKLFIVKNYVLGARDTSTNQASWGLLCEKYA